MGLAGGPEVGLHAEVHLHRRRLEPATAPAGQVRRLGPFRQAEQVAVEGTSLVLAARRHGELHVVDRDEWHVVHLFTPDGCAERPARFSGRKSFSAATTRSMIRLRGRCRRAADRPGARVRVRRRPRANRGGPTMSNRLPTRTSRPAPVGREWPRLGRTFVGVRAGGHAGGGLREVDLERDRVPGLLVGI